MLQTKNKIKFQKKQFNKIKISDLLNQEFKIIVINLLTKIRRKKNEQRDNFNKEIENTRKCQTETTKVNNTIFELKNKI